MNLLETLIIHDILVLFPILVYQYFIVYTQNMKKEKIKIIFSFVLFLSLYLSMYYKEFIPTNYQFICIILPLVLAYINKEPIDAIIISIILFEYLSFDLNYNIFLVILYFISFYLIYNYYSKTDKQLNFLVNISIILTSLMLLTNSFINGITLSILLNNILAIIVYVINIKVICRAIIESKNIINMHMSLKEFEHEKNIKINLFKITHEIKNPLAVIKGYLDMFDVKNKDKSTRYIGIIRTEVDRTLNLLTDFMDFTKINIDKKEIDLNKLVDETKDVLIPFFNSKNVSYSFEVEDNLIIMADYNRLKQVILNIIKNAVEACPKEGGMVSTTIFKEMNNVFIYVKDNGSGMDKEILERLKEPFYTTKEKGTGLGVSLSREIINSHNGNLSYSSKVNFGTICKIVVPIN